MSREKEYRYSEIFMSFQGEGHYTGVPTVWIRLWGCNLECNGFGQKDVSNPDTWVLPLNDFDVKSVNSVEDLPVWHTGCDSSYSWSKRFRGLAQKGTASEIVDKLEECLRSPHNPHGKFLNHHSGQETHLAFTGGEPMMSQPAMIAIMEEFAKRDNAPRFVTVETNGTRPIKDELDDFIRRKFFMTSEQGGIVDDSRGSPEWFWSVSPKLRVSGEPWEKAIKPDVVEAYSDASGAGQLKYVVDNDNRTWFEVDKATEEFRQAEIMWPVWVMPVGADTDMQEETAEVVALGAIDRGFNVAARVHAYVFGNKIGT